MTWFDRKLLTRWLIVDEQPYVRFVDRELRVHTRPREMSVIPGRTLELTATLLCVQGYQHELLVPQTISYHSATSASGVVPDDHAVLVQPQSASHTQATVQRTRGIHRETA